MAKIKERWYQKDAVDAFAQFVSTHPAGHNPLIVMPTGTGKSVVIALIIKWARQWQENKVLVLTHVSELVKQNGLKLAAVYPEAVIGYCSAGLGLRDTKHNIIFGTVQTVYSILKRNKHAFGERCLVIIDECHLLSEKSSSQYRTVLRTLSEICPAMRVCGLSATPYRAKGILLTEQKDPIFTDVAYDLTANFTKLIEEGYLAPLVTLKTPVSFNLEGVHIRGGEFKDDELQKAVGNEQLLAEACDIMAREGVERKAWLVFVSGIKNTETVKGMLEARGVVTRSVNSNHEQSENDSAIADFRAGKVRCLVSANQLTTGFDVPQVDMIGMLRPTISTSLHCLDEQTEILTSSGFKKWNEVSVGELCASVAPSTLEFEYLPITGYVHRQLSPDEFMLSLKRPSLDIRVSNQHRMLVDVRGGRDHHFERVMLPCESIVGFENIKIPVSAVNHGNQSLGLSQEELIFIGFWLADGCINPANNDCYFSISDRYPQIKQEIEDVMAVLGLGFRAYHWSAEQTSEHGFKTSYGSTRYYISKGKLRGGRSHLKGWAYLQKYLDKSLCDDLAQCSHDDFALLLHGLDLGDGWHAEKYKDGATMHTFVIAVGNNKLLAEKLQILAIKNGFRANLSGNGSNCLILRIKETNWSSVVKRQAGHITNWQKEVGTQEWVWCVENENGTLVTRRNGKVAILGNCQMLGRGTRPAVGKTDCLVLDFARNVERLGPINAPVLKGPSAPRDPQLLQDRPKTKFCDNCGSEIPISSRSCPICGYQPPQDLDLEDLASVDVIAYSQHLPHVKGASVANVVSMISSAHRSVKGADCVRVYLGCRQGQKSFKAWLYLCFDAGSRSLAKQAAADMWRKLRGLEPVPKNTMAALQRVHELKQPKEVELLRANLKRHYDVLVTAYY